MLAIEIEDIKISFWKEQSSVARPLVRFGDPIFVVWGDRSEGDS